MTCLGSTQLIDISITSPTGPRQRGVSSGPPASVVANEQIQAEDDEQHRPEHVARQPSQQAKVLEEVIGPDHEQSGSPEPAAVPPTPRPDPAARVSLCARVIVLLMAPCPPLVARGPRARLRRWRHGLGRWGLAGHVTDRTRERRCRPQTSAASWSPIPDTLDSPRWSFVTRYAAGG
jgi:hypothetical protein